MVDLIIVAYGQSSRFGENKLLFKIHEESIIIKTISAFSEIKDINKIIVVTCEEIKNHLKKFVSKKMEFVTGGETRSLSVSKGLKLVEAPNVLIHDGARPFVSEKLINNLLEKLATSSAVIPVQKIVNCLKRSVKEKLTTVNREEFLISQTPQAFKTEILKKAYENFNPNWFDDSQAVEELGIKVNTIDGEENNIKITYKHDIA